MIFDCGLLAGNAGNVIIYGTLSVPIHPSAVSLPVCFNFNPRAAAQRPQRKLCPWGAQHGTFKPVPEGALCPEAGTRCAAAPLSLQPEACRS